MYGTKHKFIPLFTSLYCSECDKTYSEDILEEECLGKVIGETKIWASQEEIDNTFYQICNGSIDTDKDPDGDIQFIITKIISDLTT